MKELKFRLYVPDINRIYQVMSLDVEPQDGRRRTATVWEHPCVETAIIKRKVAKFRLDGGCILLEFSGLMDRDGKEIYEGDVCESTVYPFTSKGDLNYRGEVYWNDETAMFCLDAHRVSTRVLGRACGGALYDYVDDLIVVGNVNTNPELIECVKP